MGGLNGNSKIYVFAAQHSGMQRNPSPPPRTYRPIKALQPPYHSGEEGPAAERCAAPEAVACEPSCDPESHTCLSGVLRADTVNAQV